MVIGEDYYYSDTDSDSDDDVDRYVFLAHQPAPAPIHRTKDDASSDSEDGDATADEEELEGGGGRRKRLLVDVSDAQPLPKKARLGLILSPLAPTPPSSSDQTASSPCHGKAHEDRAPREVSNKTKKKQPREIKKQGVCGKIRSWGPGCDEDGDDRESCRTVTAAAKTAGTPAAAASGRFSCSLCERCFDSHQALGGHVLGHRKKAKIAIAAAASSLDDAGGSGNCKLEDIAVVEEVSLKGANGVGNAEKMAVCDEKKAFDDVAAGDEDVDSGDRNDDGNSGMSKDAAAASHVDDRVGKKAIAASRRGVTIGDGDEQMAVDAASCNNGSIKSKKAVVGTCHKGANGNGSSNVCKTWHKTARRRRRRREPGEPSGGRGLPDTSGSAVRHRGLLAGRCGDHGGTTT